MLVAVAAAITFARGVPYALMESWDDRRFLVDFAPVRSVSLEHLVEIWSGPHFEAYHPLHLMSYWIDVPWSGATGPVVHAVNLVLWVGALLLMRRVFLGCGLGRLPAVGAVLLLGLHPAQVEAVTWATGRKEIVALMLAAASMLAHLRACRPWDRWALVSRALYVLAALAKTTVLPLPIVLAFADVLLRGVPIHRALSWHLPTALVGAALGAVVMSIWTEHEMIRPQLAGLGRATLIASTYTHYLTTALMPVSTSPLYPIHRSAESLSVLAWSGPAVLALGAIAARRSKPLLFALLSFVVLLLPVSNLVPVYYEVQDRYLSLPLVAVAFAMGHAIARIKRPRVALAVTGLCCAVYAARTIDYVGAWQNAESLWAHATRTQPDAFYAWIKLGETRRDAGDYDVALDAYGEAIRLEPSLRIAHSGAFLTRLLRDEATLGLVDRAMELTARYHQSADDVTALRTLAGDMVQLGYRAAALDPLGRSLDLEPLADERLEHAASVQAQNGNDWLAEFYRSRIRAPRAAPE